MKAALRARLTRLRQSPASRPFGLLRYLERAKSGINKPGGLSAKREGGKKWQRLAGGTRMPHWWPRLPLASQSGKPPSGPG